jgi:hypothetical protein
MTQTEYLKFLGCPTGAEGKEHAAKNLARVREILSVHAAVASGQITSKQGAEKLRRAG